MKILHLEPPPRPPVVLPVLTFLAPGEPFEDRLVASLGGLHRYGHHATAALHAYTAVWATLMTHYRQGREVPFSRLVDLLENDRWRFRGKAEAVRRLREFDARVAWIYRNGRRWEYVNLALKRRVPGFLALTHRVLRMFPKDQPVFMTPKPPSGRP